MQQPSATTAGRIAQAVAAFIGGVTGRPSAGVAVALCGGNLVVTLRGALSPAEQDTARTPGGDALLRRFHRELFSNSCGPLREEIARITGAQVLEASAEAQGQAGTLVLVLLLAGDLPTQAWSGK